MIEDEREEAGIEALLRTLDHEPPRIRAEDVIARARRPRPDWGRIAAALAVALGLAGIAYALPGSPVRGWVDAVLNPPAAPRPAAPGAGPGARAAAGMAFDPAEPLVLEFAPPLRGHLRIELIQGGEIVARVGAEAARFASEPDRLVVEMLAPDTFELRVPSSARRVEVRAGGRAIFRLESGVISAAARPRPDGRYLIPLESAGA